MGRITCRPYSEFSVIIQQNNNDNERVIECYFVLDVSNVKYESIAFVHHEQANETGGVITALAGLRRTL